MSSFPSTVDLSPIDKYFAPLKDLTVAEDSLYDFPSSIPKWFSHATLHKAAVESEIANSCFFKSVISFGFEVDRIFPTIFTCWCSAMSFISSSVPTTGHGNNFKPSASVLVTLNFLGVLIKELFVFTKISSSSVLSL